MKAVAAISRHSCRAAARSGRVAALNVLHEELPAASPAYILQKLRVSIDFGWLLTSKQIREFSVYSEPETILNIRSGKDSECTGGRSLRAVA